MAWLISKIQNGGVCNRTFHLPGKALRILILYKRLNQNDIVSEDIFFFNFYSLVSFGFNIFIFMCIYLSFPGPIAESPAKPSPAASISTLKEKIRSPFGKPKPENTRKIQLMLEETLTKNIQLQRVRGPISTCQLFVLFRYWCAFRLSVIKAIPK